MAGAMTQWRPFLRLTNAFRGSSRGITKSATRSSGPGPSTSRTQEELSDYVKREAAGGKWTGYGLHPWNKKLDKMDYNVMTFCTVIVLLVPGFMFYYKRDFQLKDWAKRESMLVLREREAAGILPVDRNYIDPAKIELPTDEELDGADIII